MQLIFNNLTSFASNYFNSETLGQDSEDISKVVGPVLVGIAIGILGTCLCLSSKTVAVIEPQDEQRGVPSQRGRGSIHRGAPSTRGGRGGFSGSIDRGAPSLRGRDFRDRTDLN